jgi:DNA mismatch endonuclease (patch repair protein)
MGYRFRVHRRDLPGNPDIVLPRYRKVIFVHGCFWHGHKGCRRATRPATNETFWNSKLDSNIERDKRFKKELRRLGWKVLVVWECETHKPEKLISKLSTFLDDQSNKGE